MAATYDHLGLEHPFWSCTSGCRSEKWVRFTVQLRNSCLEILTCLCSHTPTQCMHEVWKEWRWNQFIQTDKFPAFPVAFLQITPTHCPLTKTQFPLRRQVTTKTGKAAQSKPLPPTAGGVERCGNGKPMWRDGCSEQSSIFRLRERERERETEGWDAEERLQPGERSVEEIWVLYCAEAGETEPDSILMFYGFPSLQLANCSLHHFVKTGL